MIQKKEKNTSCIRCVDTVKCPDCNSSQIVKNGRTVGGKQRFLCRKCSKSFIENYTYNACKPDINQQIILFTKEGLGIRSTARVLKISVTTLLKRIISIA
jgi:insertion element IS1 protein InsB